MLPPTQSVEAKKKVSLNSLEELYFVEMNSKKMSS